MGLFLSHRRVVTAEDNRGFEPTGEVPHRDASLKRLAYNQPSLRACGRGRSTVTVLSSLGEIRVALGMRCLDNFPLQRMIVAYLLYPV